MKNADGISDMRLCAEKFTDRAPVWTEKFKKIKNKEKNGSVEQEPIYVMMVTVDQKGRK